MHKEVEGLTRDKTRPWCIQALPGKAGGTAVMTTVDHTLMRGSEPHDR